MNFMIAMTAMISLIDMIAMIALIDMWQDNYDTDGIYHRV